MKLDRLKFVWAASSCTLLMTRWFCFIFMTSFEMLIGASKEVKETPAFPLRCSRCSLRPYMTWTIQKPTAPHESKLNVGISVLLWWREWRCKEKLQNTPGCSLTFPCFQPHVSHVAYLTSRTLRLMPPWGHRAVTHCERVPQQQDIYTPGQSEWISQEWAEIVDS